MGYDIVDAKLVVNEAEAEQVRRIFALYLQCGALLPTVKALRRLGWTTKRWTTKKGRLLGGKPFDKTKLHNLLTNVVYVGQVCHRQVVYEGEHEAIVDTATFRRVQELQRQNRRSNVPVRRGRGALLKGLIYCAACGCRMTPSYTLRAGNRRYRYYVCSRAQKQGYDQCPTKSVPAAEIERLVVEQVRLSIPQFGPVWDQLDAEKQARQLHRLLERVDYDGSAGTLSLTLDPSGIETLVQHQLNEGRDE